jgi:hypothetical protein
MLAASQQAGVLGARNLNSLRQLARQASSSADGIRPPRGSSAQARFQAPDDTVTFEVDDGSALIEYLGL